MAKVSSAGSGLTPAPPVSARVLSSDPAATAFGVKQALLNSFYSSPYGDPTFVQDSLAAQSRDEDIRGLFGGLNAPYSNNPNPTRGVFVQQKNIFDSVDVPSTFIDQFDDRYSDDYRTGSGQDTLESPTLGAALTDLPTSTTNYKRPRTIAAGWDPNSKTMTVVFRDGTFYNYYDVEPGEWLIFHSSFSKGPLLDSKSNLVVNHRHGPADVSTLSPQVKELIVRVQRTRQIYNKDLSKPYTTKRVVTTTAGSRSVRVKTVKNVTTYGTATTMKQPRRRNLQGAYAKQQAVKAMKRAGTNPNQK